MRVADAGFHGHLVGENLAVGSGPRQCVAAWLASPEHRSILLSPQLQGGSGRGLDGHLRRVCVPFVTADFGG